MILLIDNYDSFAYNLYQQAAAIRPDIRVVRNDAVTAGAVEQMQPSHILLSPGPGYPKDAGICEEVVSRLGGCIPILGVCLGHQAICEAFGGRIKHVLVSGCNIPAVQEAARRTGYGNVTISDGTFEQMIRDAKALAAPGDAVLLSPAAASWGRFSDYEQRGRIFKEIVRAL